MPINEINLKRSIRPHLLFEYFFFLMLWVRFFLCVFYLVFSEKKHFCIVPPTERVRSEREGGGKPKHLFQYYFRIYGMAYLNYKQKSFVFIYRAVSLPAIQHRY